MKICFLSLSSYLVLARKNLGYAGGAEVEQVHLAKELVSHGYDVSFVTYRYGRNQTENVGGTKVIKTYEREKIDQISVYQNTCPSGLPLNKQTPILTFTKQDQQECFFKGERK